VSKHRNLARAVDTLPESWTDALQEFISTYSSDFLIEKTSPTNIQIVAASGNGQVALGISRDGNQGFWRYRGSTVTAAHPGGAAGSYDIYAVTGPNVFSDTPTPDSDTTDYNFTLEIRATGSTPTPPTNGGYRKLGTLTWDGSQITDIRQQVGGHVNVKHAADHDLGGTDALNYPSLFHGLTTIEGVSPGYSGNPQTSLAVSASGWNASIAAGYALVQGDDAVDQGMYVHRQAAAYTLPFNPQAPVGNPRVDAVVLRYNDSNFTSRLPARGTFEQVVGTPTAGATMTNLLGAAAIPVSALLLAWVEVRVGDGGLVAGQIRDMRKVAGPGIWGEDGYRYRLGIGPTGALGTERVT
jgi:hypothetical protein